MDIDVKHLQFKHPFTAMVAGPTGSGKTVLVRRLLQHHTSLFNIQNKLDLPLNVMWAYGQWQSMYSQDIENTKVTYLDGLPSEEEIKEQKPEIIVIDDLMTELAGNK